MVYTERGEHTYKLVLKQKPLTRQLGWSGWFYQAGRQWQMPGKQAVKMQPDSNQQNKSNYKYSLSPFLPFPVIQT
jgi:hypothetical protein